MSVGSNGNITLDDIDLGSSDAESDTKLSEYFIQTDYVPSAIEATSSHFIGRKGSGKSALFRELPRLMNEAGYESTEVIKVTPDQYAWRALRRYEETGLMPEQAHANAWKFTIAIEIAASIAKVDESLLSDQESRDAVHVLRAFVKDNFGGLETSLHKSASKLLKGVTSFNLQAFGFGVGVERQKETQPITPMIINELLEQAATVASSKGYVVILDRLDDSWDGSENARNLLIGLLKAAKEVNDNYSIKAPSTGISVLVFLRTDIYEGLTFDDKDKHRALEEHIVWSKALLRDMINARLPEELDVSDLFVDGKMRGSIKPFSYIVKRTFLRPREVIQFLQECIDRSDDSAQEIDKKTIRASEKKYSSWKVDDLKQEYRRVYPHFEKMLEALRQGYHRYDSLTEFEDRLEDQIPELVDDKGIRKVMEILFDASVIGVRLGNAGSTRFRCEDSDLVLPNEGSVYVHQSLYKGLNIREKRSSRS